MRTDKVLYIPDGYRKTATIESYATNGLDIDAIIEKGINNFGTPPRGISKGKKNYFFVDYTNQDIGEIKEWKNEEDFWIWDEKEGDYLRINK